MGALRGPATEAVDRTWRNDVTIGAAGFVTEAVIFGVLYSFGVVLEPIRIDLRASTSTVALIPTVAAFTLFFVGPVTGRLADLYGTHVTVAAGGVAMAVGLALTSLARSVWPAVVGFGVLGGLSAGLGYIPVVAQMAALPTRRAPALVGFAVAGVGAGTALAAPLLDWAVGTYGWRATYQVYGAGAVVVLGLTAWAFSRQPSIRSSRQLSVVAAIRPLIGRSDFRRLYLSLLLVCPSIYVGLIFLPSYITQHGLSRGQAAAAAAVLGICSGGGRIVLSALGGRIEPATMYRLSLGLLAASLALWLVAGSNYVALLGYAVMAGTGYGGVVGLAPTVTASRHGREGLGTILGGLYTALGAGALITGPAAGAIIDAAGYRPAFIGVGLLAAAAALIVPSGPAAGQH